MWRGLAQWVGLGGQLQVLISVFLILLGKQLVIEHIFEYNRGMQLGDPTATTREPRSRLDEALDTFDDSLAELITTVETGGLDQLSAEEKVAVWQRFETLRNRLPLIDHRLIADAEANHLSEEYCSSSINQFLIRVLQLSPGEAATRIRAAAARRTADHDARREAGTCAAPTGRVATRRCGERGESGRSWNGPCTNSPGPTSTRKRSRPPSSCSPTTPSSWRRRSCAVRPRRGQCRRPRRARNPSMTNCNTTAAIWS